MEKAENIIKLVAALRNSVDNFIIKRINASGAKGLMVSHGNILVQLYMNGKQPMTKVAAEIGKCKSTVTVLVDKLEKAGFVEREASEEDERVKNIKLTDKGLEFQKDFWKISSELNTLIWEGFSEKEKENFLEYLGRAQNNIMKAENNNCKKCDAK